MAIRGMSSPFLEPGDDHIVQNVFVFDGKYVRKYVDFTIWQC